MARIWIATTNFVRKVRGDMWQWKNVSALRLARLEFQQVGLRLPTWSACNLWSARAGRSRSPWLSHRRQSQWLCLGCLGLVHPCLCRWTRHVWPRAPLGPCRKPRAQRGTVQTSNSPSCECETKLRPSPKSTIQKSRSMWWSTQNGVHKLKYHRPSKIVLKSARDVWTWESHQSQSHALSRWKR